MSSPQKPFLKRVRDVWRSEFPFFKPVDLTETPALDQVDAIIRSLGQQPIGFSQARSRFTWYPSSFELPQQQIFDEAMADVRLVLIQHVFPKLQIEYEPQTV